MLPNVPPRHMQPHEWGFEESEIFQSSCALIFPLMPVRGTYSPSFSFKSPRFQCHYGVAYHCWTRNKSTRKLPLSQAAPCQNNAVSIWNSNCGKSLILLIHAYMSSEYTGLPLHHILHLLMMGLISPRLILWMKAVELILLSLHAATKFSGNTSYFNLEASYLVFVPSHHDLDITLACAGYID